MTMDRICQTWRGCTQRWGISLVPKTAISGRRALDIDKRTVGETHWDYAVHLNNLAGLYQQIGGFARAQPLLEKAVEIASKTRGENDPGYATELASLARNCHELGHYAQAEQFSRHAVLIMQRQIERTAVVQSERQQLLAIDADGKYVWEYLSYSASAEAEGVYTQILGWERVGLSSPGEDADGADKEVRSARR